MAKILNLEALRKETKELTFDGVTYPVVDLSVESFIEITKRAEEEDAKGETSFARKVEFLVEMISYSVPSCPIEKLRARSLEELNVIAAFVRDGVLPDAIIEAETVTEKKKLTRKSSQ